MRRSNLGRCCRPPRSSGRTWCRAAALGCDVLTVPGADLRLVTYTTTAGGPDAGKLDLLRVTGRAGLDTLRDLAGRAASP